MVNYSYTLASLNTSATLSINRFSRQEHCVRFNKNKIMLSQVSRILVVIGGVNWGLMGLGYFFGGAGANWNVVHMILGSVLSLENIVYILVGAAAVYMVWPR